MTEYTQRAITRLHGPDGRSFTESLMEVYRLLFFSAAQRGLRLTGKPRVKIAYRPDGTPVLMAHCIGVPQS